MRHEGTISHWNDDKGYGFITPKNGGPQVFAHIKAFLDGKTRPVVNDPVNFELTMDEQGRPQAKYVRRGGVAFRFRSINKAEAALFLGVALFLGALLVLALIDYLYAYVPALYVTLSAITFGAYWKDKRAAQRGQWRTQESILQALSLAGGWPGALIAQRMLRHKSSKRSFLIKFWISALVNIGALCWLMTPQGAALWDNAVETLISGR